MKAKEVYVILERELSPTLTPLGFRKKRGSRLVFQRQGATAYETIWFQMDKYGWDKYAGGKFFVNFNTSESTDFEAPSARSDRLNNFMTDDELERALAYRNEIVARIPKPPGSYFEMLRTGFAKSVSDSSASNLVQTLRDDFEPEHHPYRAHQDFALRYWLPTDVAGWVPFISAVIPRVWRADR